MAPHPHAHAQPLQQPAPGWYPDQQQPTFMRWWDGAQWTEHIQPAAKDIGQDAGMRMLMPVGRSSWAITSGYLGLISITLVAAPFAVITGIIAIRDIRKHPERHGMGRAIFGIVMGGLGCLLIGALVIGALTGGA